MTNRNRRSTRRNTRSGRTGRLVWVNHDVNEIPVANTLGIRNILANAKDFMLFDTTVVSIIIENLTWTFDSVAPAGTRRMAVALLQGKDTLDIADFTNLLVDGVGPAYMLLLGKTLNLSGVQPQTIQITPDEPVHIKAKRRFKENDQTIFLLHQNTTPAADTAQQLTGLIRTLIYVP